MLGGGGEDARFAALLSRRAVGVFMNLDLCCPDRFLCGDTSNTNVEADLSKSLSFPPSSPARPHFIPPSSTVADRTQRALRRSFLSHSLSVSLSLSLPLPPSLPVNPLMFLFFLLQEVRPQAPKVFEPRRLGRGRQQQPRGLDGVPRRGRRRRLQPGPDLQGARVPGQVLQQVRGRKPRRHAAKDFIPRAEVAGLADIKQLAFFFFSFDVLSSFMLPKLNAAGLAGDVCFSALWRGALNFIFTSFFFFGSHPPHFSARRDLAFSQCTSCYLHTDHNQIRGAAPANSGTPRPVSLPPIAPLFHHCAGRTTPILSLTA